MKGYPQTMYYVVKLQKVPWIGRLLCRAAQAICGLRGHELSKTDGGYGGGEQADRWCRWCNKLIKVPKTELMFVFPALVKPMKEVERHTRKG